MLNKIGKPINNIVKRYLHDRKLPAVELIKKTKTKLIGIESPKKADNQLNKQIKEINKLNKLKYDDFLKLKRH